MKHSTLVLFICLLSGVFSAASAHMPPPGREFYQIKIYHLKTERQIARVDSFLSAAYLPALHRAGIAKVGVFKPIQQDTADLKIYVLVPFRSLEQFEKLASVLDKDEAYAKAGASYINAAYNDMPYARLENILLKAFRDHPVMDMPKLTSPKNDRVYELRSYESPTEKYHANKVKMFNDGNEIGLFRRLGFNAVFYGQVIAGGSMPNLMYMTTFNDRADRDAHWKSFGGDAEWKKLSAMEEYKNNVSRNTQYFLRPVEYSDI
ncbi:NIPSNAP family protein [Chitinophaga sp. GCM10012297]|uniref:NIPSNAP family protein n=1 Tax=Chitinophaga chungangae TaxID=2821488 RepID=A0ABS3Y807_9BACT|nr:NIPSNAP family protein [Chitinophaga chungangae]MBO9150809.1 NIPSNAP family protein [Chitinophaga chungangae]